MSLEAAYKALTTAQTETISWLQQAVAQLRTGRVRPSLVERLTVEHYGSQTPLKGVASITVVDARTMVIAPWDVSAVPAIEKSVTEAQLGVTPVVDGKVVRLVFPSLTEETRAKTVKSLHRQAEEARIRLRQARDESLAGLKAERQAGHITEDDFFKGREKLDELIEEANQQIAALVKKKTEEVQTM